MNNNNSNGNLLQELTAETLRTFVSQVPHVVNALVNPDKKLRKRVSNHCVRVVRTAREAGQGNFAHEMQRRLERYDARLAKIERAKAETCKEDSEERKTKDICANSTDKTCVSKGKSIILTVFACLGVAFSTIVMTVFKDLLHPDLANVLSFLSGVFASYIREAFGKETTHRQQFAREQVNVLNSQPQDDTGAMNLPAKTNSI